MSGRILVVDDALFMRTLLKRMLIEAGHDVVAEAANGEEALKRYLENRPDLVIMDITMPVMSGLAALKALKAIDPEAQVIMATAMGQAAFVDEAMQLGAVDYLVKPFQPNCVLETIRKVLG